MTDASPFADLDAYVALPRVSGLHLSPDGTRLVTSVSSLDPEKTRHVTALWEIDPTGDRPARRLTRSAKGEQHPAFLPDSSLLFTSARPDPATAPTEGDDPKPALWHLPAGPGEARVVATRPGGISGVAVARDAGTVVVTSPTFPSATTAEEDEAIRRERRTRKVTALLHASYPVRYWDHDLGPDEDRLLSAPPPGDGDEHLALTELTPTPARALDGAEQAVAPDGSVVVTTWYVPEQGGRRLALAVIDLATGAHRLLLDDPDVEYTSPVVSPDSRRVAVVAVHRSTPHEPIDERLAVVDLATGDVAEVAPDWDRWPTGLQWTPAGDALVVTADEQGRGPVFRVDLADGAVTRLTGDDGTYSDVQVAPDGRHVYALRAAVDSPPTPVRLDAHTADQHPVVLPGPAPEVTVPGSLVEVTATAEDGTPLRAWLALPADASASAPAPLVVCIHGGPLGSWNTWHWRWNPWIFTAHGYALLLPDPALSTGYGREFVRRGWGAWGAAPYTDLLALTDAAAARDDVDGTRSAAVGGSFGGYMANWIATQTDRFDAIVTHASLWALDQFGPTTDAYHYWRRELTAEMAAANSPHLHVGRITTPMLVIHGDKDYRVPIGEALRLWAELAEVAQGPDGASPHRFLYFPDENHWVLKPQHSVVWYQTVLAFLATHVRGEAWTTPPLLA